MRIEMVKCDGGCGRLITPQEAYSLKLESEPFNILDQDTENMMAEKMVPNVMTLEFCKDCACNIGNTLQRVEITMRAIQEDFRRINDGNREAG